MTDKKLITNFLNKNYKVIAEENCFMISEINGLTYVTLSEFLTIFETIFGEFTTFSDETSFNLVNEWFNKNKNLLIKEMVDYLDSLNMSDGSVILLSKVTKKFGGDVENRLYNNTFIESCFNDYYIEKKINPEIKHIIKNFNPREGINSLTKNFLESINFETFKIHQYILNQLNEWYCNNILGDKLNDILNQLVIILGDKNWKVIWVGRGVFNKKILINNFKEENEYGHDFIIKAYDNWYESSVILASEKVIGIKM